MSRPGEYTSRPITRLNPTEIGRVVEAVAEVTMPRTTTEIVQKHQQERLETAARLLKALSTHPVIGAVIRGVDPDLADALVYVEHNASALTPRRHGK